MNYTAVPVGGTPPFQYSWLFGDGTNGSGNPVIHTYSSVGTYTAYVFVNDSLGEFAWARFLPVQAAPPVTVVVSAAPGSLYLGDALSVRAEASGGFPPYVYSWSGLPTGCTGQNVASFSCIPSSTGVYNVSVLVTDELDNRGGNTTGVTVSPAAAFSSDGPVGVGWGIILGGAATVILAAVWVRRPPRSQSP